MASILFKGHFANFPNGTCRPAMHLLGLPATSSGCPPRPRVQPTRAATTIPSALYPSHPPSTTRPHPAPQVQARSEVLKGRRKTPAARGGGGAPRVLGRQLPLPPPPPLGASGQQLVAKGAALGSPWAPKAPDAPWAPKPAKGKFCPLCTPALFLNPTLTLTPTPTLNLVLTLPRAIPLPLAPSLALALT